MVNSRKDSAIHGHAHEDAVTKDWRRRISDHLAYALLVYTALQIFVTMKQLKEMTSTTLPYLALIVLVAMIIPAARMLEKHWSELTDAEAFDPAQASRFKRDRIIIWVFAIGMPFVLAGIARLIAAF